MARDKEVNILVGARDAASRVIQGVGFSLIELNQAMELAQKVSDGLRQAWEFTAGAAADEEETMNRLKNAVEISGGSWETAKGKVGDFLTEMQNTTRFGDSEMAEVLQKITTLTGDFGDATFDAAKIVADMASSGMFDLESAGRLVAQAMAGNVEVLGRYIPQLKTSAGLIDDNMSASEKWATASEILRGKFAGMATGEMNTFNGQIDRMNNLIEDIGENVGAIFLPILTDAVGVLADLSGEVADFIKSLTTYTPGYIQAQRDMNEALANAQVEQQAAIEKMVEFEALSYERRNDVAKDWIKRALIIAGNGREINATQEKEAREKGLRDYEAFLKAQVDVAREHFGEAIKSKALADAEAKRQEDILFALRLDSLRTLYEEQLKISEDAGKQIKDIILANYPDIAKVLFPEPGEIKKNFDLALRDIEKFFIGTKKIIDKYKPQLIEPFDALKDAGIGSAGEVTDAYQEMLDKVGSSSVSAAEIVARGMEQSGRDVKTFSDFGVRTMVGMTEIIMGAVNKMADNLVDVMLGGKNRLKEIWRAAAVDFLKFFVEEILKLAAAKLIVGLISILSKIFDTRANDMMAMEQGRHFAEYFTQGVLGGIGEANLGRKMAERISIGAPGRISMNPSQQTFIQITINNPIGTEEFVRDSMVPALENIIYRRESKIALVS